MRDHIIDQRAKALSIPVLHAAIKIMQKLIYQVYGYSLQLTNTSICDEGRSMLNVTLTLSHNTVPRENQSRYFLNVLCRFVNYVMRKPTRVSHSFGGLDPDICSTTVHESTDWTIASPPRIWATRCICKNLNQSA